MQPISTTFLKKIAKIGFIQQKLKRIEADYAIRADSNPKQPSFNYKIPLVLLALIAMGSFFAYNIYIFTKWPPAEYSDSLVYNLTKNNVTWDVHYGSSQTCGDMDCHLKSDHPSSAYERKQILPVQEFPLKDFKKGDHIYYRASITIPKEVKADKQLSPLVLHIPMLWGDHYELYINEASVDGGAGETVHVAIPEAALTKEVISISFKVSPGGSQYQGIANYGNLLIGSKERLKNLKLISERLRVTYYIWLFLPRLAFAMFFAIVYLAFSKNKENYYFLIYSLLLALQVLLFSDLGIGLTPTWLPRIWTGLFIDVVAYIILANFFITYYRRSNRAAKLFAVVLIPIIVLTLAYTYISSPDQFALGILRNSGKFTRLFAIGLGLQLSFETAVYLADRNLGRRRLENASTLMIILTSAWIITATHLIVGFLKLDRQIFFLAPGFLMTLTDYVMLFFIAGAIATEFGNDARNASNASDTLRVYLGKEASKRLLRDNEISLRKSECDITVMFTDIRSFTTLSETHEPEIIVQTLNEYFGTMGPIISKYGGSIDKFIGDSIMAEWGGAGEGNDPYLAVKASIEMRMALTSLNQDRESRGLFPLAVGIGIHFGRAISGSIGSQDRRELTVIGDTVNVAARIQDQTKVFGADILISDSIVTHCAGKLLVNKCSTGALRGRQEKIDLYRLLAIKHESGELLFGDPTLEQLVRDNTSATSQDQVELPEQILAAIAERNKAKIVAKRTPEVA